MTTGRSVQGRVLSVCVDVGSPRRGNVGWAIVSDRETISGADLMELAARLTAALAEGLRIAIGFECPLHVPKRADPMRMLGHRAGESSLSWCGGPGASVLATGIAQANWVLNRLAEAKPNATATLVWREFDDGNHEIFVWEAFITSKGGLAVNLPDSHVFASDHARDAVAGALAFHQGRWRSGAEFETHPEPVVSLAGLHLLDAGLSRELSVLSTPCLIVRVRKPTDAREPSSALSARRATGPPARLLAR